MKQLAKEVKRIRKKGAKVVIVSSGAIACGFRNLKMERQKLPLDHMQALAAIGQVDLIENYKTQFLKQGIKIAQLLITRQDFQNRLNYLNARATLEKLIEMDIVPIINENDFIATEEINFGDNDQLSAQVSQLISADLLILLSDIDGLYDKNPKTHTDAKHIAVINKITDEIINSAEAKTNKYGTGGMASKIKAASIATASGIDMIITKGVGYRKIFGENKLHSFFKAKESSMAARKLWLSNIKPMASITVNTGAAKTLVKGKSSLLPVGVSKHKGKFHKGDMVEILSPRGKVIAKGLSSVSSEELTDIMGKTTEEIIKTYKYATTVEVVHIDNMVVNK